MAARQSAMNTVTMTGSLRPTAEARGLLHAKARARSRATKEAHQWLPVTPPHQKKTNSDPRSGKITERCTMKSDRGTGNPLGNHERSDLNGKPAQALGGQRREQDH